MKSGSHIKANYVPDRGDIVWLNFTPQTGHEQRGKRPALILSPKIYNEKTSLCICLPITSKVKGFKIEGVILSDQVKNLDFVARDITYICKAPSEVLVNVQKNVLALVG